MNESPIDVGKVPGKAFTTTPEHRKIFWDERQGRIRTKLSEKTIDWIEIHELVLDALFVAFKFKTTSDKSEDIFVYDYESGVWKDEGETIIRQGINQLCSTISLHNAREIIGKLRRRTYFDRARFNALDLLVFNNCVYDLETEESKDFNPAFYLTNKMNVNYDELAECPRFDEFMERVLPDRKTRTLVWEMFAYLFVPRYPIASIFILYGEGANGKSVLASVIKKVIGEENISGVTPKQITNSQYASGELYGKLANICDELDVKTFGSLGTILKLTGNFMGSHERKHKGMINFVNRAKMIYITNPLPIIYEDSYAIWRRVLPIHFSEQIPEDEQIVNYEDCLTTPEEMSGIINKLLDYRGRLLRRGRFDADPIPTRRERYTQQSNILKAFAEECLIEDREANTRITVERLANALFDYARAVGNTKPISKKYIGDYLANYIRTYPKKRNYKDKKGKVKSERVWLFIRLREDFEEHLEELEETFEGEK